MRNENLDTLKMVRELVSAIKTRVCGEKAPLWQDDYHTTFSRGVIADQCDYAIAAVAPIIARMEQNTGTSGMAAGGNSTVTDTTAEMVPERVEIPNVEPAASDVEALVGKIKDKAVSPRWWDEPVISLRDATETIRAHFNAAAGGDK